MRSRPALVAAFALLAGCAGTSPTTPPSPGPSGVRAAKSAPVPHPRWTSVPAAGQTIAEGSDTLSASAPARLGTDLSDAAACLAAGTALADRAARNLPRVEPPPSAATIDRVRSNLSRVQHPGCRILERAATAAPGSRRILWSLAVLDSSESLPALRRELAKLDSSRAGDWSRRILELP